MNHLKTVGVVLAGGIGARIGLGLPKQLIKIAGRTILEHTLETFQEHSGIDEIIVMMAPGHLDQVRAMVKKSRLSKVTQIVEGAHTRNETTKKALRAVGVEDCHIILHDAVRPLLSANVIDRVLEALNKYDAVDVAIASADTIIEVEAGADGYEQIVSVPDRSRLRRGQTPQAFRASCLSAAYKIADADPTFIATDDCSVVLKYTPHIPVAVIEGEEWNMKVTQPIDIYLADKLFQLRTDSTTMSASTDLPRLDGKVMVIFGGSYGIGKSLRDLAEDLGCHVRSFSRSETGTHVQDRSDVAAAREQVLRELGRIDLVVNTAGTLNIGRLTDTSEEDVYAATDINYLAPIFIAQEFHEALAATQGSLLLFTSSSYTRGRAHYSLYSSAKAATVNLTQALADEWADSAIRVNCINPERTNTPMRHNAFGNEDPKSLLSAEDVAQAALITLSGRRTGHVVDVRRMDPMSTDSILEVVQG